MPSTDIRRRDLLNFAGLLISFVVGQGGLFFTQTIVLAAGNTALLASFGTQLSFTVLALIVTDFGGQYVLGHDAAAAATIPQQHTVNVTYWHFVYLRSCIGTALVCIQIALAFANNDPFSLAFVLCSLPAVVSTAFSITGLLEGNKLSGINGVSTSAPYIAAAAALPLASSPNFSTGVVLGLAFSAGALCGTVIQFAFLPPNTIMPIPCRFQGTTLRRVAFDGWGALTTLLPGQMYYRLQLVLAHVSFDTNTVAAFIYAKQLATAFAQFLGFVRRIQFPYLVAHLAEYREARGNVHSHARPLITLAFALTLLIAASATCGLFLLPPSMTEAAFIMLILAPSVMAGGYAALVTQHLQAMADFHSPARITIVGVGLASAIALLALPVPTVLWFALSDATVYGATAFLGLKAVARKATTRH
jgi:hypothetical protein